MFASSSPGWRQLIAACALVILTLLAYQPAWHGERLWDDDAHLTRPELQSVEGLGRIWTEIGVTQQYYPVSHSVFWTMHRLWGDHTLGYHLVNILLHVTSAILVALLLRQLAVPGALLTAALFALHPVHVESVAWMTELKNTLSGVLYFSAALVYLRFEASRRWTVYAGATMLFVLALLSKTVTASLPAALLVIFWWQHGRLDLRKDVAPLAPWLAMGLIAARVTAQVEHTLIGAQGIEFDLSLPGRVVLAGRAVWFYVGKLFWPADLMFVYPRWTINPSALISWLYPSALVIVVAAAWWWRPRSRAPLAVVLLFVGTLTPALGFVDVFPFRYSYVADHFQYLATVPLLAGAAAMLTLLAAPASSVLRISGMTLVVAALGAQTWRQAHQYVDVETLYQETLRRNPGCWLALNNLGTMRLRQTPPDVTGAVDYFQRALALYADNAEAHNNLGVAYSRLGRFDAARAEHETAVRIAPNDPDAHNNLGTDLERLGERDGALREYLTAVRLRPRFAEAHYNAGNLLAKTPQIDAARSHLEAALAADAAYADAYDALGTLELQQGRADRAVELYQHAVGLDADAGQKRNNLGMALERLGRLTDARDQYERATALLPAGAVPHDNLGFALFRLGDAARAEAALRKAISLDPALATAHANLGNLLLDRGDVASAIVQYRLALASPNGATPQTHNNLGVALAQQGRRADAAREFSAALALAPGFEDARRNLARATGR